MEWMITSFAGAFAFGFMGKFAWGKMVDKFGPSPIGGCMCAGFLVGTFWVLNHFLGLIVQPQSNVWVDQGFAIGCAFLFSDVVRRVFNKNSLYGIILAIAGGALAGFILSLV